MSDRLTELRSACAEIANSAQFVRVEPERTAAYIATLPVDPPESQTDPDAHLIEGTRDELTAFWLTLDAINFGSGWFPTLRKREGRSGYYTIATGVRERFTTHGPWSAAELATIDAGEVARRSARTPTMSSWRCSLAR